MSLANVSSCALSCLLRSVAAVGCLATDTNCICEKSSLAPLTAACLTQNCTMQDSLDIAKLQASTCHLSSPTKSRETLGITAAMFTIAFISVSLRFLSIFHGRSTHKEDILVAAAVIIAIIPVACVIKMTCLGFGEHLWSLEDGALAKILQLFYVAEVIYVMVLCLVKLSLIFFYMRVFPGRTFRDVSCAAVAFTVVPSLTLTFLTAFSCRPVELFWNKDIKGGRCLDISALAYANSGFAVAQDFLILALGLSQLPRLQIKFGRKIGVGFMIILGSFGWIVSVIRVKALTVFGQSVDPTWDYVPITNWTAVELATGVLCGCLPAIRSLLARYFPNTSLIASQNSNSAARLRMPHEGSTEMRTKPHWSSRAYYTEVEGGSSKTSKPLPIRPPALSNRVVEPDRAHFSPRRGDYRTVMSLTVSDVRWMRT